MNKEPRLVMVELNEKFNGNFDQWNSLEDQNIEKVFIGLHCIALIGEILNEQKSSKHHEICCKIYDEIFSDGVSALYLASNAMDKPANIVLRRVLELGLAALYLWDMPHMAFSWDQHDQNLSFTDMLNHINSKGFISYINKENNTEIEGELISSTSAQRIYGLLSDIVHGKIATFESSMPDRFVFIEDEWNQFVDLIEEVVVILLKAYLIRFNLENDVLEKLPQAKKVVK
jgi:hypothetical protein